jgi:uncharacterized protein (TIGR02145 family)
MKDYFYTCKSLNVKQNFDNMKKIFLAFAIFAVLKGNAQNYLIAFTGSGASNTVSTVKVENVRTGQSLTLNGNETLNLKGGSGTTGIDDNRPSSGIKIYPNPMIDNSTIEIYPPVSGDATISIFDISGKQVTQIHSYLENSMQEFRLSGDGKGLYIITVRGNTYQFSGKLICNGSPNGIMNIEQISSNQTVKKSTTVGIIDMLYLPGDKLKFTGVSGNYKLIKTDIIDKDKTITFDFTVCADANNSTYSTVEIDNRVWMAENLKSTKYNDGADIPYGWKLDSTNNDWNFPTTPGYVWYNNNESLKDPNGALYNWLTVNTGQLCPDGWHVPTSDEWKSMKDYLWVNKHNYSDGTNDVAKSIASTSGWVIPQPFLYRGNLIPVIEGAVGKDQITNNSTGFNGYPSGSRHFYGYFTSIGTMSVWWSSTGPDNPWDFSIVTGDHLGGCDLNQGSDYKRNGFSVRCVKD